MSLQLVSTFSLFAGLFYFFGVYIPKNDHRQRAEIQKIVCLVSITAVIILVGVYFSPENTERSLQSLFQLDLWSLAKVILLNSFLFSYVFCCRAYTNELGDLWTDIKKVTSDYMSFKIILLAPLIEELYFRLGFYLLSDTKEPFSRFTFLLYSSVCFGACHLKFNEMRKNIGAFVMTFVFGLYAAFIMLRTQNIWCCLILHTYCNIMGPPGPFPETENPAARNLFKISLFGGILIFFILAYHL
jgi:membrane protease YdiL (CAAX protease family)